MELVKESIWSRADLERALATAPVGTSRWPRNELSTFYSALVRGEFDIRQGPYVLVISNTIVGQFKTKEECKRITLPQQTTPNCVFSLRGLLTDEAPRASIIVRAVAPATPIPFATPAHE